MSVSEGAEYSMRMRVTVIVVVVFLVMVVGVRGVVVIVFVVVGLVCRGTFHAVCCLGRVKHPRSHGN